MRVPHLPVVVERGGVKRRRLVQKRARHAEQRGHLERLARQLALVGHAHVGEKRAAQVEARELDAVVVAGNRLEDARRDALRGLALVVAGEHAVHVGVVDRPEALVNVHGKRVRCRDHEDALLPVEQALPLEFAKAPDEVRRDEGLLHLVAAHGADDSTARLRVRVAEFRCADLHRFPIGRGKRKDDLRPHRSSSKMRATSEPG